MRKKKETWNYRVVKEEEKKLKGIPQGYFYSIRDVYYRDGVAHSWGKEPQHPIGETFNDFCTDFFNMQNAIGQYIMEVKDGKIVETKSRIK